MLVEYRNVRQVAGEGFRRWFSDDYFDLIVWYDGWQNRVAAITGFQLCYDKRGYERALTWRREHGFSHEGVDEGEMRAGGPKATPILVADGIFDSPGVAARFREASDSIEPAIADLVLDKLAEFPGKL